VPLLPSDTERDTDPAIPAALLALSKSLPGTH
jgi:hypothetical protein